MESAFLPRRMMSPIKGLLTHRHAVLSRLAFLGTVLSLAMPSPGRADVNIAATGDAGTQFVLSFPVDVPNPGEHSAVLCSSPVAEVENVDLWMPDHGHGSGRVVITPRPDGCVHLGRILFLMPGHWQVRVSLASGEKGILDVTVVR